jgi:hypothetical protein
VPTNIFVNKSEAYDINIDLDYKLSSSHKTLRLSTQLQTLNFVEGNNLNFSYPLCYKVRYLLELLILICITVCHCIILLFVNIIFITMNDLLIRHI